MKIEIECCVCKRKFYRNQAEVNRNARIGRKTYCSLKCSGKGNVVNIPEEMRKGDVSKIRPYIYNRQDEYSMFRVFMHRINLRKKDRNKECNLTLKDLKEQWEKQKGICPYTGWQLKTPKNTDTKEAIPRTTDMASLDRMDSTKGYLKGNIEFVSLIAQYAKNNFEKTQVLDFCKAVTNNWKGMA